MVARWWHRGVRTDTDRAEDAGMGLQRIRTIKPEFFLHEDLARVSFAGRLLYIGLWTVADCVGSDRTGSPCAAESWKDACRIGPSGRWRDALCGDGRE